MTYFASELRQNPKTRLRSVLLRLDAGPTTGSGRPEPEICTGGPRSSALARATRPLLRSPQPQRRRRAPPRLQRHHRAPRPPPRTPRTPPPFRERGPHVLLGVGGGAGTAAIPATKAEQVEPPEKSSARGGESASAWAREGSSRTPGAGARRSYRHKLSDGGAAAAVNFAGGLSRPVASRKGERGRTPVAWAFNGEEEAGGVASSSSCEAGPRRRARPARSGPTRRGGRRSASRLRRSLEK
jgi:hypothetical protein